MEKELNKLPEEQLEDVSGGNLQARIESKANLAKNSLSRASLRSEAKAKNKIEVLGSKKHGAQLKKADSKEEMIGD